MMIKLKFTAIVMLMIGVFAFCGCEDDGGGGTTLTIGMKYQGGKIACIFQPGDPGYVAGETHGLIAATADQSADIIWAIIDFESTAVPGGTETALGTGSINTDRIIAQNGAGTTYAAGLARAHRGGDYTDWYLPSKDELNALYINRVAIGGFADEYYWSSSESPPSHVWCQNFDGGIPYSGIGKSSTIRVRAVRAF